MTTIERLPPHSQEAEEAILGSLLIDPEAIYDVASFLKPQAFYRVQNQWIYEAILSLNDRREPIDFITLTDELRKQERLEDAGGEGYIIGLINSVPTSINARHYARLVEAASVRRRLIGAASTIANLAYEEAEDISVVIDRSEQALFGISEERTTRDLVPIKQIASNYLERIEELRERGDDIIGVPTGFTDLDRLLGGLNKSDLIILAARPGMGKCVTADTKLINPHTGALIDIETLVQQRQASLLTLTENYQLQSAEAIDFIDNGLKPVYQVTTALGREIKTTLSHPFLTLAGWQPLYELQVGDRVAVPRLIPVFGTCDVPEYEAKVLAYLIADGSLRGSSPQFSNTNPILRDDFSEASLNFPGNKVRLETSNGSRTPTIYVTQAIRDDIAPENFTHLCQILDVTETDLAANGYAQSSQVRNSLTHWLIQLGIWGKSALEKDVPAPVFEYTRSKLALFLNRLFACDGSIYLQNETQPVVSYATSSKALAQSVRHLLLRFGIIAKLRHRQVKYRNERRPSYQLRITDPQSILAFVEEIGALGKEDAIEKVKARCQITHSNTNQDTIPGEVWELVMQAKGEQSWADLHRKMGYPASHNMHVGQRAPSRQRLQAIAEALSSDQLLELAQSDVYWDAIVAIEPLGKQQVYDLSVAVTHNFVADDMIVHNTSLQNAIALTAARRHGKRVAIFNLEMSGEQLVQRMIAAETRIDSQRLRRGQLYDHEWPIFLEAIGRLSETHIFIDDTPSITPLQLRTKCRRLYAEHGLDLVMIDYLQLMSSDRTNNNRVMEISEISRSLKTLARELDAPVLAAAQLSRAVESRAEKRPVLSDLRDSGCLTGDTLVTLAENGRRVPIRDLDGQSGFCVWALNEETMKLETAVVSRAFSTGIKPVYRLTTQLGRTIKATANHKFRTFDGWKRLDELQKNDFLALPRLVPTLRVQTMQDAELALLGHLIGDGCVLPRHAIQYTTREKDLAELVARLGQQLFGDEISPRIRQERTWYQVYLASTRHHTHGVRNAVSEWFDELEIFGLRSHEKRVPELIFEQPEASIAIFLRHLWATDGCIRMRGGKRPYPAIYYASSSFQLAADVQSLLLRLGITTRLKTQPQGQKGRNQYHVIVGGRPDIERFVNVVGTVGAYKTTSLRQIQQHINHRVENTNRDVIPNIMWRKFVVPAMQANGITSRQMQAEIGQAYCGTSLYKQNVSRERAARVAQAVHSDELMALAESDVYWDKIASIEFEGEAEVYDLTVPGPHNFVANDMIPHNSIEQDADIVMFIYRDEYYNPDTTERPNIAEISIAKHRNGPTGTVDLYWHGQLATFRNLQRQEINL